MKAEWTAVKIDIFASIFNRLGLVQNSCFDGKHVDG
jgi:hypothetical protein